MKLNKNTKRVLQITSIVVAVLLLILVIVYATKWNDPISRSLKQFFPAKIVGWHMVSVYDLQTATLEAQSLNPSTSREQVAAQLVRAEKMRNLARQLGLKLKSDDETDELAYLTQGEETQYATLLKSSFNNRELDFVKFVVYPQAWEALVKTYYNGNTNLHKDRFELAQSLLDRINKGEKFDDLAKQYSDDRTTGQLGGDLGFVRHAQIIPELEDEVTSNTSGQVINKVVVTRLGYHLVYPVETAVQEDQRLWHVKHILITTDGFDKWFEQQADKIWVVNLLN